MRPLATLALCIAVIVLAGLALCSEQPAVDSQGEEYFTWTAKQAESIGKSMREKGRVGAGQGLLHTERASSYKLRATWLTPEVVRATARLEQIKTRLSDERTRALVTEAETVGDTVLMVEIDPREGSGVVPIDWQAFLQPKGVKAGAPGAVTGTNTPRLRDIKALAGVAQRDYDYDVFWIVFPLKTEKGEPIFSESTTEAELVVRIYNKEGKVSWRIPNSIRSRSRSVTKTSNSRSFRPAKIKSWRQYASTNLCMFTLRHRRQSWSDALVGGPTRYHYHRAPQLGWTHAGQHVPFNCQRDRLVRARSQSDRVSSSRDQ